MSALWSWTDETGRTIELHRVYDGGVQLSELSDTQYRTNFAPVPVDQVRGLVAAILRAAGLPVHHELRELPTEPGTVVLVGGVAWQRGNAIFPEWLPVNDGDPIPDSEMRKLSWVLLRPVEDGAPC